MRNLLSIAFGVSIWALLQWGRHDPGIVVSVSNLELYVERITTIYAREVLELIVPWLLVGITARSRPILCGAVAAAVAALIFSWSRYHWSDGHLAEQVMTSLCMAVLRSFFGMAGAALGVALVSYSCGARGRADLPSGTQERRGQ
ncbi:hypothetical protein ARC20_13355 [Stenotrophomonas panacihumi]|uniref:Uncharacterized protein n=1 Tax=Stenotrophomonas panacihumi TaxID=676599 RepID=A0A0R0A533_9GAMM|nr:hypothetical protein [Stenotrophomonas panacihumi]KRG40093.1 hypothetical protein ARC20_13355 [Stenotrophomonas panacihumi]PTN53576.1 hypothetical protein C9J98_14845 [Stenotrophomonas panacihumi]